jgi:hypothetical protein
LVNLSARADRITEYTGILAPFLRPTVNQITSCNKRRARLHKFLKPGSSVGGRSCPSFSTSFTANIAVRASLKCGNSFSSGRPVRKFQNRHAMPVDIPIDLAAQAIRSTRPISAGQIDAPPRCAGEGLAMPLAHDPEKCAAVFPRDKRVAFGRRSCANKKLKRDGDSS